MWLFLEIYISSSSGCINIEGTQKQNFILLECIYDAPPYENE